MNATFSRSTAAAGKLAAGHALHVDDTPVVALLNQVASVADAHALQPVLARRLATAEAAVAAHGAPDPILEDAEHAKHAEEHARLKREVDPCRDALERLAERRAELAIAEAQAAARETIKAAERDATDAERLVKLYTEIAARLGDVLDQLERRLQRIMAARLQAADAGIADEAAHLQTPAERRLQPARLKMVTEIVHRGGAPRATDAEGRPLKGRGGRDLSAEPTPAPETRGVEKMTSPPMRAPDLTRVRIERPSPEAGVSPLVDRRGER